ncbi:integral membrane protein [Lactiplantibacillus plantarum]|nr:integral membrane protein [Lactiplantibacillus plantarum]MCG0617666.1 integral membrane protein [Lactiplantibacillus plantarum]MCG0806099.1 integral membrane protein [Lactiplantibacillus plantarum]MCG0830978.1 integral membrane protein [Lactiplantibacillus plantarum]MCG0849815.1 integral membrane protein [Lactiplantibacillus plantarum]
MTVTTDEMIIATCLKAGKIMVENGSEISRVDDTMMRIAQNAGVVAANTYVTITGVMMSIQGRNATQIAAVNQRTIDLEKVAQVNQLSREFVATTIDLPTLYQRLNQLDAASRSFPLWLQLVGAALVSGPLMIMFRQEIVNTWPTVIIGTLGYLVFYLLNRYLKIKFLSELTAALLIGFGAEWVCQIGWGTNVNDIIIGSLMPLVPGVPLTNAVRDTLAGNFVSGPARGVEAMLSAAALGFGIAVVITLF